MLFFFILSSLVSLATPTPDLGFCGVAPFETGKWDPYWKSGTCPTHDKSFNANKAGLPNPGFANTTGTFIESAAETAAQGAYAVVMFLPYTFLATIVGGGLWLSRVVSRKQK